MAEERIETLTSDVDAHRNSLWFDGPAEFLVQEVVKLLRLDPFWGPFFGCDAEGNNGFIDDYMREDYPIRALPALRIYNETYDKQFDSWFVEGDLILDVIWPANIRREDTQKLPDAVSSALMQQFRRPGFFTRMGELVPGLNELGKRFSADKTLGFKWGEDAVPLTQLRVNFKIDLRVWDDTYLEATNRTKDMPFKPTLGDLKRIVTTIQAVREDFDEPQIFTEDVTVTADQSTDT